MITDEEYRITRKTLNKLFHTTSPEPLQRKLPLNDQEAIVNTLTRLREVKESQ